MYYFSDSYEDGREKFLAVCEENKLSVESHINPCSHSPTGGELAMDVVWCGLNNASRVLVVTTGTHGLEAATGSATVLQWLNEKNYLKLPKNCAVLIVHTVNPFGWAFNSRTNEDNVDLNRNFLDHNKIYPSNDKYQELYDLINVTKLSSESLHQAIEKFHQYEVDEGKFAAIQAITAGQYTDAEGLGYGGNQASWSKNKLIEIVQSKLNKAQKIVSIDWHTGIGEYGKPFFISIDKTDSLSYKLATQWWHTTIHSESVFGDGLKPDYTGLLMQNLNEEMQNLNGAQVLSVVIEMGTYELDSMLQALIIDNYLRRTSNANETQNNFDYRLRLVERFYPSMPEWRNSVLIHSERIYRQALNGLSNW
jgi:hypothetical protein